MPINMFRFVVLFFMNFTCFEVSAEYSKKLVINLSQIESVAIAKEGHIPRKLSKLNSEIFANHINESKPIGLCKYAAKYFVTLRFKDGNLIDYRINGSTIKAENDYCFNVPDPEFFTQLWSESGN